MKKPPVSATIIICLIVIGGGIVLSACSSIAAAQPNNGVDAYVNTAAAATMVQYLIETQVAVQSVLLASPPAAQVQATEPPAPTYTPFPTYTPLPTYTPIPTDLPQPTAAAPAVNEALQPTPAAPAVVTGLTIRADQNTNCRAGPNKAYDILTVFMKGSQSTVLGRDSSWSWWYITNPNQPGGSCWVWDSTTTVLGDASALQVVAAPPLPNPSPGTQYFGNPGWNPWGWSCGWNNWNCCGFPGSSNCGWNPFKDCWKNAGWWTCCPAFNCNCKPAFRNPCRRSGCPAVTEVNFRNYCRNYPRCCK